MSKKEMRHRRTAQSFKKWLKDNEKVDANRKLEMFNAIADAEYARIRQNKARKGIVPVKRIESKQ